MNIWVNTVLNRTVVDRNCCFNNVCRSHLQSHAQVVEMSVTVNNSPIQDYIHPDDHTQLNTNEKGKIQNKKKKLKDNTIKKRK